MKMATEMAEWTDSGDVVPKRQGTKVKCSYTCVGLDPGD